MMEEKSGRETARRREELSREVFGSTKKRETREEKAQLLIKALLKREKEIHYEALKA